MEAITAISSIGGDMPGSKVLGKFKHYLTVGVTFNPTFKVRNLIRDSIASIAISPLGYNPLSNVRKGLAIMNDQQNQTYASLLASGGIIRFGTMLEGNRSDHLRKLINAGIPENTIVTGWDHAKGIFTKYLDKYNELGDKTEGANRAALYQQLRAQGKSHAEAAFEARDLLDFSMGGTSGAIKYLTTVVPFMNARIQGLNKLAKGAAADPSRFATVLGATALASLALLLKYRDDDDWKKREAWDRDTYWWFKVDGIAYRIPKPFEIGAMATLAERTAELFLNDEMTGKQFGSFLLDTVGNTFAMNPVPQAVKPAMELWANKNMFTKQDIESAGMSKLAKSERYNASTSEGAKLLGKAEILSPVQIDHLAKAYFGWIGTAAITMGDLAARGITDSPEKADRKLKEMFFVGNFAETLPSGSSQYVTQLYKQSREITEAYASYKHMLESGDVAGAQDMVQAHGKELALNKTASSATATLAKINAQMRAVNASRSMSGAEKRAALDSLEKIKNTLAESTSKGLYRILS